MNNNYNKKINYQVIKKIIKKEEKVQRQNYQKINKSILNKELIKLNQQVDGLLIQQ